MEPGLFVGKSMQDYMKVGFTWYSQIGRMKSDVHAEVQRTKCITEHQPELEAEDSFQIGLAPNGPVGLDHQPLDNREQQGSRSRTGAGRYQ